MNLRNITRPIGELRRGLRHDLLSSLVVFLVALPLCMGIAIASGAPVAAGLITGIVAGLVVGWLAGCPLQVSGPAAGLTIIVYEVIQRFGLETLGIVVLLAGALQLAAGALRLGQWFRAVSPAVVKGMLAGIGVLIFASQFHVMIDDRPRGNGFENLVTIPYAVWKAVPTSFEPGTTASRRRQSELLHEVGELHRRQVNLQEHVAEYSPHVAHAEHAAVQSAAETSPDAKTAGGPALRPPRLDLLELASQQRQLTQALSALIAEIAGDDSPYGPRRRERIGLATDSAELRSRAALAALQEQRLDDALPAQDAAVDSLEALLARMKHHTFAAQLGVLTILVILLWGALAPKRIKFIPGPLIAVALATAAAAVLALPVLYVEVPDNLLDEIHFPSWAVLQEAPWLALLESAALMAVVASAETLLSATAVDQLHRGRRTQYNRELCAQGAGNVICGLLGALPMTGVIVRSSANVQAGARSRLSAVMHGAWLLLFVAALGFLLRMIPTASLAAVLVYTGYKLIDWKGVRKLAHYGRGEVAIYAVTLSTIVISDLLSGVLLGVALAAVRLLMRFSRLKVALEIGEENRWAVLKLEGAATFLRLPKLASALERVPGDAELHVDIERLRYIDHACLELLVTWARQHEAGGGRLSIDWDSLHATLGKDRPKADVEKERNRAA